MMMTMPMTMMTMMMMKMVMKKISFCEFYNDFYKAVVDFEDGNEKPLFSEGYCGRMRPFDGQLYKVGGGGENRHDEVKLNIEVLGQLDIMLKSKGY